MSFGQSFQITPLQLLRTASAIINGGTLVTPHFGVEIKNAEGTTIKTLTYETKSQAVSKETSETMKMLLEAVVAGSAPTLAPTSIKTGLHEFLIPSTKLSLP